MKLKQPLSLPRASFPFGCQPEDYKDQLSAGKEHFPSSVLEAYQLFYFYKQQKMLKLI
jgi:hypothetical protein